MEALFKTVEPPKQSKSISRPGSSHSWAPSSAPISQAHSQVASPSIPPQTISTLSVPKKKKSKGSSTFSKGFLDADVEWFKQHQKATSDGDAVDKAATGERSDTAPQSTSGKEAESATTETEMPSVESSGSVPDPASSGLVNLPNMAVPSLTRNFRHPARLNCSASCTRSLAKQQHGVLL